MDVINVDEENILSNGFNEMLVLYLVLDLVLIFVFFCCFELNILCFF